MSWFLVDDKLHSHAKVAATSNAAMGLWVRAGSWCAAHLTDGHLTFAVVKKQLGGSKKLCEELVNVGLWETTATGWVFHGWLDIQHSREDTLRKRAADLERKRAGGRNSRGKRKTGAQIPAGINDGSARIPTGTSDRSARNDDGSSAQIPVGINEGSARIPTVLSSPTLPSEEEKKDLNPPTPNSDLTPLSSGQPANTNGFIGGGFVTAGGTVVPAEVVRGQRWLNELLMRVCTRPAPSYGGKWSVAYGWIGERPDAELGVVCAALEAELRSRRLTPNMCTPRHVADYWSQYLDGEAPGRRLNGTRQGSARVSSAEAFAADEAAEGQQ